MRLAAQEGNPDLRQYSSQYVLVPESDEQRAVDNCLPVKYIGTGFMLTHRSVYERVAAGEQGNWYRSGIRSELGVRTQNFFECPVVDGNLISEDYEFCRKAKAVGVQPYAHLGVQLGHVGSYEYRGDVATQFTERTCCPVHDKVEGLYP